MVVASQTMRPGGGGFPGQCPRGFIFFDDFPFLDSLNHGKIDFLTSSLTAEDSDTIVHNHVDKLIEKPDAIDRGRTCKRIMPIIRANNCLRTCILNRHILP